VVKHAQATEVCIRIATTPDELSVTVADDGRGIAATGVPKGDGTLNMQSRLDQIGGHCDIRARPGGGTIVCFRLPTNPDPTL
jgi:signal transduction histidine kinase